MKGLVPSPRAYIGDAQIVFAEGDRRVDLISGLGTPEVVLEIQSM